MRSIPNGVLRKKSSRLSRRWIKAAAVFAVLLVLVLLFRGAILAQMGRALVTEDPLREADAIVILMGSIPDRVVHGADLYQAGYADTFVMVDMLEFDDYAVVGERGLVIPRTVEISKDVALQLGVPEEDIVLLGYGADSTYDEAVAVQGYVEAEGKETVIVVTSRYHSSRSKKTFERVLGKDVEVISSPSPYDPFDPEGWWKDRAQARAVFLEYQKFVNFYLFQR